MLVRDEWLPLARKLDWDFTSTAEKEVFWGEAFIALNLVLKPMIDELFLKHTSNLALGQEDHLLGQILYSLNEDCHWHRQWTQALIQTAIEDTASNREVIQAWIDRWYASALDAIEAFSPLFEGKPAGPQVAPFHNVGSRIDAFCAEYLRSMSLQPGSLRQFSATES